MRDDCYLVFDRSGALAMRKTRPNLRAGEHAVKVTVDVPDRVFKADLLEAFVSVSEPTIIHPLVMVFPEEGSHA